MLRAFTASTVCPGFGHSSLNALPDQQPLALLLAEIEGADSSGLSRLQVRGFHPIKELSTAVN